MHFLLDGCVSARRTSLFRLIVVSFVAGLAGVVHAGDQTSPADRVLKQIVATSAEQFAGAYERGDAAAIAKLFTPQAEYVDAAGMVFHGRGAIEAEFTAVFQANAPSQIAIEIISIRPVADGVLVEEGVSSFSQEANGPTSRTRYAATHVKQSDGSWLMASVRILDGGQMTPHDRLRSLDWLVGEWQENIGGNVISTQWNWSKDGNFLIGEFSIRPAVGGGWTGTHRIGWDAARKQFRSWIFESSGGATQGWWRGNEDGSWSVRLDGINADGTHHTSVLTYQRDGEDAIVVIQDQRMADGESIPGSVHRIVRRPPSAEVTSPKP